MTLRRRLILLHSAFAVFAVGAAVATIYAVKLQVERAADRFEGLVDQVQHIAAIRADLQTLDVHLHEILDGDRPLDEPFEAEARASLTRLGAAARFSASDVASAPDDADAMGTLHRELDIALAQWMDLIRQDDRIAARQLFKTRIEGELLTKLDRRLRQMGTWLDVSRQQASSRLLARDTQLLLMALVIAVSGAGLVMAGALIVRRRLVKPIEALQAATGAFAEGHLHHRVELAGADELGSLGRALNNMAGALQTSQRKYQTLFQNLRDTVIICDASGIVQECHEGDGALLGVPSQAAVGQRADGVWPRWRFGTWTWAELIHQVLSGVDPLTISDLPLDITTERTARVDIVAYSVEYAAARYAVVVMRDVTERHNLQRIEQRAETMEAAVHFARGIAHDFKNLLHSALTTLSVIEESTQEATTAERTRTVLEACRQAASLSRRLTRFASSDEVHPEVLCLSETVCIIVESLGERVLTGVRLEMECDDRLYVRIDRDQLTQIVINLVYNACEAMPSGGTLRIATALERVANPLSRGVHVPHVVLAVQDTGIGMSEDVIDRAFEPLFSTRPRGDYGPRGMGLAVVYAAVNNAGGFIMVASEPGQGTTFRVCLPRPEDVTGTLASGDARQAAPTDSCSDPPVRHADRRTESTPSGEPETRTA